MRGGFVQVLKCRRLAHFFKDGLTFEMLEKLDGIDPDGEARRPPTPVTTNPACSWRELCNPICLGRHPHRAHAQQRSGIEA